MRRNRNRKPMNKNKSKNAPELQLSKQLSLNTGGVKLNVIAPVTITAYSTSGNYSFSNGSDVRALAFSSILSGSGLFADFAAVYSQFKIISASIIVCPYLSNGVLTDLLPMLYMSCDSTGIGSNPSNSDILSSQSAHLFSATAVSPRSVTFRFPGVSTGVNIWLETSASPAGAMYIASTNTVFSTSNKAFDCSASLVVAFRTLKAN